MKIYTAEELKEILKAHRLWVEDSAGGTRANLRGANLYGADLEGANLRGADLKGANLRGANLKGAYLYGAYLYGANLEGANLEGANLEGANLRGANLRGADLKGAYLYGADLEGANLRGANLYGANLCSANLRGANLYGANLYSAYLYGAYLPAFMICPEQGEFIAFKKLQEGIAVLSIPESAKRTSSYIGRKCRAEFAKVISIESFSGKKIKEGRDRHSGELVYRVGKIVRPDSYNPDPRVECTNGIHFFITRKEAEEYC